MILAFKTLVFIRLVKRVIQRNKASAFDRKQFEKTFSNCFFYLYPQKKRQAQRPTLYYISYCKNSTIRDSHSVCHRPMHQEAKSSWRGL